jgi:hypothetical protein
MRELEKILKMTPLRITAIMQEPVVYYGDGLHLDGPLAYGVFQSLTPPERDVLPPIASEWASDFELPLDRWYCRVTAPASTDDRLFATPPKREGNLKMGEVWGWKCSAAHADWVGSSNLDVTRPPPLRAIGRYSSAKRLEISSGRFKASLVPYPQRLSERLCWFAVGDPQWISRLLACVLSIGKFSSKGSGRVRKWLVEEWPHDWSIQQEGVLTRRMPVGYGLEGNSVFGAIRAPYHHASRRTLCVEPDYEALSLG